MYLLMEQNIHLDLEDLVVHQMGRVVEYLVVHQIERELGISSLDDLSQR